MLSTFEYDMSLVVVSVHSFRVVASRIMTSWPHRSSPDQIDQNPADVGSFEKNAFLLLDRGLRNNLTN